MAVALRSSATVTGTSGNITCNVPSGVADGDFLLLAVSARNIPTITTPSGWTLDKSHDATNTRLSIFYRTASSEPSNYTVTIGTNVGACAAITAWTGVDTGNPFNQASTSATGVPGTFRPPDITTTRAGCAVIQYASLTSGETYNTPSGFTEIYDVATIAPYQSSGHSMAAAYKLQTVAGSSAFATQAEEGGFSDPLAHIGQAIQLHSYALTGEASTFTLTGRAAGMLRILKVLGAAASFALTGVAAAVRASRKLSLEAASFAFVGVSANIGKLFSFVVDAGSFVGTGVAAALVATRSLTVDVAAFSLVGVTTLLLATRKIFASAASVINVQGGDSSATTRDVDLQRHRDASLLAEHTEAESASAHSSTSTLTVH